MVQALPIRESDKTSIEQSIRHKLATPGKIEVPADYLDTLPYEDRYLWGKQTFFTSDQIGSGILSTINPFDHRTSQQILRDANKEVDRRNAEAERRARILTALNKMGVTFPPPMQVSGKGDIASKAALKLSEGVIRSSEMFARTAEMAEFVSLLPVDMHPKPPEMKGWTITQEVTYVMQSGNDGYAGYLTAGGDPVPRLDQILAHIIYTNFNVPGTNIPVVPTEDIPQDTGEGTGLTDPSSASGASSAGQPVIPSNIKPPFDRIVQAAPNTIATQSIDNKGAARSAVLRQVVKALLATKSTAIVSDSVKNIQGYINTLMQRIFSKNTDNQSRLLDIFTRLGVYIPTNTELKSIARMGASSYGPLLARYIIEVLNRGNIIAKSLSDILRLLIMRLPGQDPDRLMLLDGLRDVDIHTPETTDAPEQTFNLRESARAIVEAERKNIDDALLEAGYTFDEADNAVNELITRITELEGLSEMSESEMVQIFGNIVSSIELLIRRDGEMISEIREQSSDETARDTFAERVFEWMRATFPSQRFADEIANLFINWVLNEGPQQKDAPASGKQSESDVGDVPSVDEGKGGTSADIPTESKFSPAIELTTRNTVTRTVREDDGEGGILIPSGIPILNPDVLNATDWANIESSFDNNIGTSSGEGRQIFARPSIVEGVVTTPIAPPRGFRIDFTYAARSLARGNIVIRRILPIRPGYPGGRPEDPYYEIDIGGRRYVIRRKTLIWLLSTLIGISTSVILSLINAGVNKLEGGRVDTSGGMDGKDEDKDGDDPHSTIPKGGTHRNQHIIGGEAYVLGATDAEIDESELRFKEFTQRQNRGGEIERFSKRLYQSRFNNLREPLPSHRPIHMPVGRSGRTGMRNVLMYDPYFNDVQENVYHNWTPVMHNDRTETADDMNKSIYYERAYNDQIMNPRVPITLGSNQKRWDGLDHAPFTYDTNGLLNEGNHFNGGQLELYPNIYGFPVNPPVDSKQASIYKASRVRR